MRKPLYSRFGSLAALAALGLLLAGQYQAGAWLPTYTYDFSGGPPDTGWTHWAPLPGATFTVTSDGSGGYFYALAAPPTPSTTLGPARLMTFPPDAVPNNYTNFSVTVDILPGWASGGTYVIDFGLVARMQNLGGATPEGYAFGYVNAGLLDGLGPPGYQDNFLAIYRTKNGLTGSSGDPGTGNAPSAGNCEYHFPSGQGLDNSKTYRIQFIGKGTHLEGRVYDVAVSTNVPMVVLDAVTAGEYTNGPVGFFAENLVSAGYNFYAGSVDISIDNYTVSYHSPYEIRDDFNNQSDGVQTYPNWSAPAWVEYDPLGSYTLPPATYSFPNLGGGNYGYEIYDPAPPISGVGPARAGSLREEVMYSDFFVSADVCNWNDAQRMAFGLFARGSNIGGGTTDGYLYSYEMGGGTLPSPTAGDTDISALTAEQPDGLTTSSAPPFDNGGSTHLTTGKTYHMTFQGKGSQLTGYIYDGTTVHSWITASDSTYKQGYVGLISASQGDDAANPTVNAYVTFDNFYADINEPRLQFSENASGHAVLQWPGNLASIWVLQSSSSVDPGATWTEIPPSDGTTVHYYYNSTTGLNTCTNPAAISAGTTFFRLLRLDPLAGP